MSRMPRSQIKAILQVYQHVFLLGPVIVLSFYCSTLLAENQTTILTSTPDRCVSLHKGQTCYQKVSLTWQSTISTDYCLFQEGQESALKCWLNTDTGELIIDFQSAEQLTFILSKMKSRAIAASTSVTVFWVYQTKRKNRGWRLF